MDKIGLVTTYSTHWDHLKGILGKHCHLLILDNGLKQILGFRPSVIAKRAPTIGDTLVHSEYTCSVVKKKTCFNISCSTH